MGPIMEKLIFNLYETKFLKINESETISYRSFDF